MAQTFRGGRQHAIPGEEAARGARGLGSVHVSGEQQLCSKERQELHVSVSILIKL